MNYYRVPSICDQVSFFHGPRELFSRYFQIADDTTRDLGVRLRISWDFDRLIALNERHSENWPPLSPIFDPKYNELNRDNAFMIEGVDEFGETVIISAGRLYDYGDRSVASALRSLQVFYNKPEPHIMAGDHVEVSAPSAEHIFGRVMYSGAVWVKPEYRRHGLTKVVPRLARVYGLTQWNTPLFWATIDPGLDTIGVTRAYGSWHAEDGVIAEVSKWRTKVLFLSMGQATLIRDIAGSVDAYETATGASRWIDSAIANKSSALEHQGMSTRS